MRKTYTLIEVLITVVVVLILSSLGMATYRQLVDNAYQKVCETNLKTLESAVEIYALENGSLPATLGELTPQQVHKAYARIKKEEGLSLRLAEFIVDITRERKAYAAFLTSDNLAKYGADAKVFIDPADKNGGVSYGINANLTEAKLSDLSDQEVIADSDTYTFTPGNYAPRHIKKLGLEHIAKVAKKRGKIENRIRRRVSSKYPRPWKKKKKEWPKKDEKIEDIIKEEWPKKDESGGED